MDFQYERVPRWILVVGVAGATVSGLALGWPGAAGFAAGSAGSFWNYHALVRVVKKLGDAAVTNAKPSVGGAVFSMFFQLFLLGVSVLVILKYSKISLIALLVGLFASCIAIGLELSYELVWKKSTKSG